LRNDCKLIYGTVEWGHASLGYIWV